MGSICDMNDLERFMRSPEGKARLQEIRKDLQGRTIWGVDFVNEVDFIGLVLHLSPGKPQKFGATILELSVDAIREDYPEVLEREYHVDYPERKKV